MGLDKKEKQMKFTESYKKILEGARVTKAGLNVTTNEGPNSIDYLSLVTPSYVESGKIIRNDAPFIAAFDEKNGIHRLSESNAIAMLLSEDDDWCIWEEKKEEVKECSPCQEASCE